VKSFTVTEEPQSVLPEIAGIPMWFMVESILEPRIPEAGLGGIELREHQLEQPWRKDYDMDDEGPATWARRFDITNWGFLVVRDRSRCMASVVVAWRTPGLTMLDGREDLAVIWDLRVAPDFRRQGLGTALIRSSETWARDRGCTLLKVETQNVNVPACRLYARSGFRLGGIHLDAYPGLPREVQLLWYRDLAAR
jgi:ribosomal protein S18 acetylase RimI-like enzyme